MSDKQLEDLLAREAIRDLPVRYCDCVWRDDVAGIVDLFSANGEFTIILNGTETTVKGTKALKDFYLGGLDMKPRPYIHNHVVDLIDATNASGRCYLDLRCATTNMDWLGAGYYEDKYIIEDGRWKFDVRRFNALRMEELPPGLDGE